MPRGRRPAWSARCAMPLDGRLWVLTFHRVGDPAEGPPGLLVSPALFERQMRWLAASGRAVGVADVAAARAGSAPLPRDAVLVTFEDAYRDFAEVAWPILRRHGIPATLFVPTAFADGGLRAFWWDRLYAAAPDRSAYRRLREQVKSLPHDRALAFVDEAAAGVPTSCDVLSWAQLRDLAREGVAIGAHTRTHPLLDRLSPERAREEVIGSVEDVRERLGVAPAAFAYPGGAVTDAAVVAAGDAGVGLAFTTEPGVNDVAGADWLRLRRIAVGRRMARPALQLALSPPGPRVWRRRAARSTAAPPADRRPAVAYVMSRFPKLSETFVLGEILALER